MTNTTNLITSRDPVQGLVDYVLDVKPYHTKIIEILIEYIYTDNVRVNIKDLLHTKVCMNYPASSLPCSSSDPAEELLYCGGFGISSFGSTGIIPIYSPDPTKSIKQYPVFDPITKTYIVPGNQLGLFPIGSKFMIYSIIIDSFGNAIDADIHYGVYTVKSSTFNYGKIPTRAISTNSTTLDFGVEPHTVISVEEDNFTITSIPAINTFRVSGNQTEYFTSGNIIGITSTNNPLHNSSTVANSQYFSIGNYTEVVLNGGFTSPLPNDTVSVPLLTLPRHGITVSLTPPISPLMQQIWVDLSTYIVKIWSGSTWVSQPSVVFPYDPITVSTGTLWLNTITDTLFEWNPTTWSIIPAIIRSTDPTNISIGTIWLNSTTNQYYTWNGTNWVLLPTTGGYYNISLNPDFVIALDIELAIMIAFADAEPVIPDIIDINDPITPTNGTYWINSINDTVWLGTGTSWVLISTLKYPYDPFNPILDGFWINSVNNNLWQWNGNEWILRSIQEYYALYAVPLSLQIENIIPYSLPTNQTPDESSYLDIGSNAFIIDGNHIALFQQGTRFEVFNSSGNDRVYTTLYSDYVSGKTRIRPLESIQNLIGDGMIKPFHADGFSVSADFCANVPETTVLVKFDENIKFIGMGMNFSDDIVVYDLENRDVYGYEIPYGTIVSNNIPSIALVEPITPGLFDLWFNGIQLYRRQGGHWAPVTTVFWIKTDTAGRYIELYRLTKTLLIDTGWEQQDFTAINGIVLALPTMTPFGLGVFGGNTPGSISEWNPAPGTLWLNTITDILFKWNPTLWDIIPALIRSTDPINFAIGIIWLNSTTNQYYTWNGTSWDLLSTMGGYYTISINPDFVIALDIELAIMIAYTNATPVIPDIIDTGDPVIPINGTYWINSINDRVWVYNGIIWVLLSSMNYPYDPIIPVIGSSNLNDVFNKRYPLKIDIHDSINDIINSTVTDELSEDYTAIVGANGAIIPSPTQNHTAASIIDTLEFGWAGPVDWFQYNIMFMDSTTQTITVYGNAVGDIQLGETIRVITRTVNSGQYQIISSPIYNPLDNKTVIPVTGITVDSFGGVIESLEDFGMHIRLYDTVGVVTYEDVNAIMPATGMSMVGSFDAGLFDIGAFDESLDTIIPLYKS